MNFMSEGSLALCFESVNPTYQFEPTEEDNVEIAAILNNPIWVTD